MRCIRLARAASAANEAGWDLQRELLEHLEKIWREPRRGHYGRCAAGRQHFTHSKAMAWVAFDRAIKSAEMFGLPGPLDHWRGSANEIHNDVCTRGY